MNSAPPPMIQFDDVFVSLGGNPVLQGFSLAVSRGEIVAVLGRSGSGKSTALKLVNGLLSPGSGRVSVDGRPVAEWDSIELRRGTGFILQEAGLFPHFSVARNVALVPRLLEWESEAIVARVDEMLELVGLEPTMRDRLPSELSGGQRQRVGIARALAARPRLLLCDEPFGALDPVTRYDLQREFLDLCERLGTTLLFVTHDVREARLLGDRIAFLRGGRLSFVGTEAEFDASTDPSVVRFREAAA